MDMINLKHLAVTFFIGAVLTSNAQDFNFDWAIVNNGSSNEFTQAITIDSFGNVYTTGQFQGTTDFDPGVGVTNITPNGSTDIYIQKLDANGNLVWIKTIGGTGADFGYSIELDTSNNVIVTGAFSSSVDFDPNAGISTMVSNGFYDAFILKLDNSGNYIWSKSFGGSALELARDLQINSNGDLIVGGYFASSVVDFDPGSGVFNINLIGSYDPFIQKLDANGNFIWAKVFGGVDQDQIIEIAIDNQDNIFSTGYFENTVDFDPNAGTLNHTSNGGRDAFIQKLDVNGNLIWAKAFGGSNQVVSLSIASDIKGNCIVAGYMDGTADLDPGTSVVNHTSAGGLDIFMLKLDVNGDYLWSNIKGGTGNESTNSVVFDKFGNVFNTGPFTGPIDFNPGIGVDTLNQPGLPGGMYLQKLDSNGNFIKAEAALGTTSGANGFKMKVDYKGGIFVAGNLTNQTDFDPSTNTYYLSNTTQADPFVVKWSECITTTSTISPVQCNSYVSPSGNYTWTISNTYTDTILNAGGCDSIITINLTINNVTNGTDVVTACGSHLWVDGNTYTANNTTATHTITNGASNGCDSIVTLNLTINNATNGTDVVTACGSHLWIDGNTYTANNTTATHTITNGASNGCDSIVTLNLTINNATNGTDVVTACGSHLWIDGNTYTANNTTATHTITNGASNGCDSIVTLNLTINNATNGTDVVTACGSHLWIDGNTYTANNTTATHTITNGASNGCDSIVTLNLTINNATNGTDVVTACGSHLWIDGNTYTANNTTATHTIINGASNGCDSIVTLNLTINNVNVTTTSSNDSISANTAGATYQWLDCDNNYAVISGETNQLFVASSNGSYAVEVTQNGCTDTSSCINITGVGLADLVQEFNLNIYPNPNNGTFTINFDEQLLSGDVKILDVTGREVFSRYFLPTKTIDLNNNLTNGLYSVIIITEDFRYMSLIVVE